MLRDSPIVKPLILSFIVLMLFACTFITGGRFARKNMQISYISQSEILTLEKARIAGLAPQKRELFFAYPHVAVKYIEEEQARLSKNGNMILLSDGKIYGANIRSISAEVHRAIIAKLESYAVIKSEEAEALDSHAPDIHAKF
jgi:hypothetical protein